MVVAPAHCLRVISWNLLHGQAIPPVPNQEWTQTLIYATTQMAANYQPDFISIQEVDYLQPRSNNINQTKVIAENSGLKYWAYLPAIFGTPGESWKKVKNLEQSIITENSDIPESKSYGIGIATNQKIIKLSVKKLGRSIIGMPLLIPKDNGKGARFIYVKDEPRVALVAQLENGLTIATTHLSFVPGVNIFQLNRLSSFLKKLPGEKILTGDLNLPANIPSKLSGFKSLAKIPTYPSWGEKIQFDYIMARSSSVKSGQISATLIENNSKLNISDHSPIGVEIRFQ
jgi:endonuclease/exonuclease/phosphatase family metal-dependent hydrolase